MACTALLTSAFTGGAARAAADGPTLAGGRPCSDAGFTCSMLRVPLDHFGPGRGTLDLQVATADNATAPKGVLLFLTGGPGQDGVQTIDRIARLRLPELAADYRFVMLDQRGTGEFGAIDCPLLQAEIGGSDIAAPTPAAVTECAKILGPNAAYYSTDQTVADLDALRVALHADKMVVDGVSYGSFVAERYAIRHPGNVRSLILDSVVPHHLTTSTSLYLTGLQAQARVFRSSCEAAPVCGFDPAEDLAWVVRHRGVADGVRIFDLGVSYEFEDPGFRNPAVGDLIGALHSARGGDPAALDRLLVDFAAGGAGFQSVFSTGLHAATLCADLRFPWGTAATPTFLRAPLVAATQAALRTSDVWPYTAAVATHQGFISTCALWPAERPGSNPGGPLPDVPVLVLNGDHDLSTPLEWAQEEAASAPDATLVVVPGASHSIQNRELGHVGRDAVIGFLAKTPA